MNVNVYINDVLNADLTVRTVRASYVRAWESELQWTGRHDDPPSVELHDDVRIEDDAANVLFRGTVTEVRPGGVDAEGIVYLASGRRFILQNEPVRINGRGYYLWNRRGVTCQTGWGGEDSPGRDGGKWTAGEIIIDILEHALGLPDAGSDISGHHTSDCCVPDPFLDPGIVAGYSAVAILSLDSVVGEFSVSGTSIADALSELLALNGGFYGWYIDPDTGNLVVRDLDTLAATDLEAGRLGHWQDEAGTDYVLMGNELEWSLDGVCSTLVIQGQDATVEVRPSNIEGSGNPAMNDGGQLEKIDAPWHGWPAAYRARCQPYRLTTSKPIDLAAMYTPPSGWLNASFLPRVYRGTPAGAKWAYYPWSGVHPIWLLAAGIIVFNDVPHLAHGERLFGWYWARQPFTVSAGPDGDAYHWYGYERTRWIYDANFRSTSSWPDPGTSDDAVAMGVLAERLLRIYRDVRRQGTLRCDQVDFDAYNLNRRYSVTNLGPGHLPCPAPTSMEPATTTEIGGYSDPTEWHSLRINAVDVLYDFTQDSVEVTVANTFWMLEEYSALKNRLEMNLFAQRELALSQDILECQISETQATDPTTVGPATTEKPATTTAEPATTVEPTTAEPGPTTTTGEPGSTTTVEPTTTTTGEPTTTTTVEPASTTTGIPGCPDECDHCPAVLGVWIADELYCGTFEYCEGQMWFDQVVVNLPPDPPVYLCEWQARGTGMPCGAMIWCAGEEGDAYWFLEIQHYTAPGSCVYRKPATSSNCPTGTYTLYSSGNCDDCPDELTVTS